MTRRERIARTLVYTALIVGGAGSAGSFWLALNNFNDGPANRFWGHVFMVAFFITLAGAAGWLILTSYRVVVDLRQLWRRNRTAALVTATLGAALAPALDMFARNRISFEPPYHRWLFLALFYALVVSMLVRIALTVTEKSG